MTSSGRMGIDDAVIYMDWANDGPFLPAYADPNGHYMACGIPADWPIAFEPFKAGYEIQNPYMVWYWFSADSRLDIELKRR